MKLQMNDKTVNHHGIAFDSKALTTFCAENGIRKLSLFGSVLRDDFEPDSDIDVLVEFSDRKSLMDIVGIEQELSDALEIKVDLLTEKSISPYLIDRIKREMVVIYG